MLLTDADRDRFADLLAQQAAADRLTVGELERRMEALLRAATREEASALIADLPPLPPTASGAPRRRWGRGYGEHEAPAATWQPTNERFRDPKTRRIMRVWVDPATGERHYVPDGE
jgi:Domain of unknown function (DUF1707)